jgi:regulatory protein
VRGIRKIADEAGLYDYAVGALGRRMRSVAELKRLLRQKAANEDAEAIIERIITRLKDQKYLNDTEYAASFADFRKENEKFGKRRVITDLKARGVHADIIEKTVSAAYEGENETDLVRAYLRRKRLNKPTDQKQAARMFRTLVRAGFGTRAIIGVLKHWDVDDDTLTLLESETES